MLMASSNDGKPTATHSETTAKSGLHDTDLDARRARLDDALARNERATSEEKRRSGAGGNAGWGAAVKISSEFIAGVLVGAGIGYLLDTIAGTAPWGMIVFLLLGFAAGILNVMRSTGKVSDPYHGQPAGVGPSKAKRADGADEEQGN